MCQQSLTFDVFIRTVKENRGVRYISIYAVSITSDKRLKFDAVWSEIFASKMTKLAIKCSAADNIVYCTFHLD